MVLVLCFSLMNSRLIFLVNFYVANEIPLFNGIKRNWFWFGRDAYGFAVRPQHVQRYREYANIYKVFASTLHSFVKFIVISFSFTEFS